MDLACYCWLVDISGRNGPRIGGDGPDLDRMEVFVWLVARVEKS